MRQPRGSDSQAGWKRGFAALVVVILCVIWLVGSGIVEISWSFDGDQTYRLTGRPSRRTGSRWVANVGPKVPLCSDTCYKAKDGVCDDGRTVVDLDTREVEILCDLGSDCSDCGPWAGDPLPDSWTDRAGPVSFLQRRNYTMFVRRTLLPSPLYMVYTNPKHDVDVSGQMNVNALVEAGITKIFYQAVKDACDPIKHPTDPGLVLDVGANFGYYSLVTASMGCRVIAWEPVPTFRAFFSHAVALNNFTSRVQIRPRVAGREDGKNVTMVVPQRGIWGTAGVDGLNIDMSIDNQGDYRWLHMITERVDSVVKEDVVLLKIDVEGFEPDVYAGTAKLMTKHHVEHVVMEYSPGIFQQGSKIRDMEQMPGMLLDMKKRGYTILHSHGGFSHDMGWLTTVDTWDGALPGMPEVTMANLKYDMADAARAANGTLACTPDWPLPQYPICKSMPEGYHPKSFKSTFSHNTNIWAYKDRTMGVATGPASLVDPLSNFTGWTVEGMVGSGGRLCAHMSPEIQVVHRCKCPDPQLCERMEQTLERAAKEGKLPFDP